MAGIDDVLFVDMLLQIGTEEGADWDDLQSALARGGKPRLDQCRAQPLSAMTLRNDGMVEADGTRQQVIGCKCIFAIAQVDFKPSMLDIVANNRR